MPLERNGFLRVGALLFLLASFVLLLIASLSVPIIKSVAFIQASEQGLVASVAIKVGLWGICTITDAKETCSAASLGFRSIFSSDLPGLSKIEADLDGGLSFLLVLHPVAAGVTLLALAFSAPPALTPFVTRAAHWLALLAAVVVLVTLLADAIFFNGVKEVIDGASPLEASLGTAFFLVLAALVLLFVAVLALGARKKAAAAVQGIGYGTKPAGLRSVFESGWKA